MIEVIKKKPAILVAAALMVFALAMLAGCGGGGAKSIVGTWHFTEIVPSEASMKDLDESQKADREAEATMLSVFMNDAEAEFAEDGSFTFTFLGDKYKGKWEEADGGVRVTMEGEDYTSAGGLYKIKDNKLVFEADGAEGRLSGYVVTYESGPASGAEPANSVVTNEGSSETSPSASAPEASETSSEAAAPSETSSEASAAASDSSVLSDAAEAIASSAAAEAPSASSAAAGQEKAE